MKQVILSRAWVKDIMELCEKDDPNAVVDASFIIELCKFYLENEVFEQEGSHI